ncbi:MAG: hypothetical protein AAF491_03325, partial [Verrucomicrobiota bacterium]
HLSNRLELTEEQIKQVRPLVYRTLNKRYESRKAYMDSDVELIRAGLQEMIPLLEEKQVQRAEKMFENWKKGKERFLLGNGKGSGDMSKNPSPKE